MAGRNWGLKGIAQRLQQTDVASGHISLLELVSDRRVLIENYRGIYRYSDKSVIIHMDFGCITVNGANLELSQMDNEQLVITGMIQEIMLSRGEYL